MKISIPRAWIFDAIVVAILLATVPSAIVRFVQTGDPYLFTRHFFQDLLARLSGPGRMRFILQPAAAILLGARDGRRDSRAGSKPFLWKLALHGEERGTLLRHAFQSTHQIISIAVLLDLLSQFLIFREIHPGAALVVGPVLIGIPYAVSRALSNRLHRRQGPHSAPAH